MGVLRTFPIALALLSGCKDVPQGVTAKLDKLLDALSAHVTAHPDATLEELVAWVKRESGITVCVATMWATLEALELTVKKNVPRRRAGASRRRRGPHRLARDAR